MDEPLLYPRIEPSSAPLAQPCDMLKSMKKQMLAALGALFLAGCASWNYPMEDAGEGIYYAESPPDYVYVGTGLSYGPWYPWIGPPYLYPMTFHSPYHYLGSRWYHPPFGTIDYWYTSPLRLSHAPTIAPYRVPDPDTALARKGGVTPGYRKFAAGRYAAGHRPAPRVKTSGVSRPQPSHRSPTRAKAGSYASPRSRPARAMRPAPSPQPSVRSPRRKID